MSVKPHGIHHVTAIARDPQQNVNFYSRTLGLRLVKQTVNFDAPNVWHLYYGDSNGSPASIITFFPWRDVPLGQIGAGVVTTTSLSIPLDSVGFWHNHLSTQGTEVSEGLTPEGYELLQLRDLDGMQVELVATPDDDRSGWDGVASIPAEMAIRGLHSVTLGERSIDPTAGMLLNLLGMDVLEEAASEAVFGMGHGGAGAQLKVQGGIANAGRQAGGTVHHVAFRAPDLPTMELWQQELLGRGVQVTQIMDRQYFKSIYFREPGGVLFEIATDDPGFDIDEPLLELGMKLKLPPWLEPSREQIERSLPKIEVGF